MRDEKAMKYFRLLILIYSFGFLACQKNVSENKNQTIKPTATVSGNTKIKTGSGKGVVTKINTELGSVELNHEEIKGMMPAMQMEFYVSDKKMLDGLKIGDKVDFVLEDNAGAEQITSIVKK